MGLNGPPSLDASLVEIHSSEEIVSRSFAERGFLSQYASCARHDGKENHENVATTGTANAGV